MIECGSLNFLEKSGGGGVGGFFFILTGIISLYTSIINASRISAFQHHIFHISFLSHANSPSAIASYVFGQPCSFSLRVVDSYRSKPDQHLWHLIVRHLLNLRSPRTNISVHPAPWSIPEIPFQNQRGASMHLIDVEAMDGCFRKRYGDGERPGRKIDEQWHNVRFIWKEKIAAHSIAVDQRHEGWKSFFFLGSNSPDLGSRGGCLYIL